VIGVYRLIKWFKDEIWGLWICSYALMDMADGYAEVD